MKKTGKLLQKQKDRYIKFKELLRNYVELENRIKALGKISHTTNRRKVIFKTLNRKILLNKSHSLTTPLANFVKDSILRNHGVNISIPVDIYIEK